MIKYKGNVIIFIEVLMNAFERLVYSLQGTMPVPQDWSVWHIVSILLTAVACAVAAILMRRASNKQLRVFLAVAGLTLMTLEVFRQSVFSMFVTDGVATWDMQWYLFPFHFCSLAMYISFIAGLVKPGKFQEYLLSFLATFVMLAGFIVMIVPSQVFCHFTYVNVQTMVHHGGMLVITTAVIAGEHVKLNFKTIMKGFAVFAVCVSLGLLANEIAVLGFNIQETFNMFFISRHFDCPMPVFSDIFKLVPYPVFLLIYLVAFIVGTCLVVYAVKLVMCFVKKIKENKYAI